MMKKFLFVLTFLVLSSSQGVFAHGGKHPDVNEERLIEKATISVNQFTHFDAGLGFGKLDKSWKKIPKADKRIHKKGDNYYMISVNHKAAKKILYILMSPGGAFYSANFTGKFEGIE